MATLIEIRKSAFNLIEKVIVLKSNVKNGCLSDKAEFDVQILRLEGVKKWAIENNEMQTIKNWFCSKNFGSIHQFSANEISLIFYNN